MRVERLLGVLSGFCGYETNKKKSNVKDPALSKTESTGHPEYS